MSVESTTRNNSFLKYFRISAPEGLEPEGSAFAISVPASLSEEVDQQVKKIFAQDDPYKSKTFSNGILYRSCCFHGALGTYPFDGISQRIIEGKDKFEKALVLTTSYQEAKKQGQRLCHHAVRAGRVDLLDRIRTATSIEKSDPAYADMGPKANDGQILFYDISQLRSGIGTEVKKIKESFYDQAKELLERTISESDSTNQKQLKKEQKEYLKRLKIAFELISGLPIALGNSKLKVLFAKDNLATNLKKILLGSNIQVGKVFESRVADFLKKQKLTGTTQLYLNGAEEFTTPASYEILQELVKQIKKANKGGDFKLAAIANFNYSRGPDRSLEAVFSHPIYLRTPKQYQLDKRISQEITLIPGAITTERKRIDPKRIKKPSDLIDDFILGLSGEIQKRIVAGDQRIFVRNYSNQDMQGLRAAFTEAKSNISYGWVEENKFYFVDDKGTPHELASPAQLLANWGQSFKVLMHSGYFDRLEEPADTVITATKAKGADILEEFITPLYALRSNSPRKVNLLYNQFVRSGKDAPQDQDPAKLLKEINSRHTKQGRGGTRQLSSRSGPSSKGSGVGHSSDVCEAEAYYEQQWVMYSEPVKQFWLHAFGTTSKLRSLIASYVRERDNASRIVGDSALFKDELDYVWDLLNSRDVPDSPPTLEHKRRDVFESLFRQMSKTTLLRDYIAQYPSLLGIETQRDAQERVACVYKPIYSEVNKSTDPIISQMDNLFSGKLSYGTQQSHRSNLIGEFLFQNGYISILEEQVLSSDSSKFENTRLQDVILKLTGAKPSEADTKLVSDFKDFIAKKVEEKQKLEENTRLGISRKEIKQLVENYLLEHEADFVDTASSDDYARRENQLVNAACELNSIDGDNDKFYRYLCAQPGGADLKRVLEFNSDLLQITDPEELAIVINNLKFTENTKNRNVISNWKTKFDSIKDRKLLLASFILEKKPELVKVANREDLIKKVELLAGVQRLASKDEQTEFRSFINFVYEKLPWQISNAVSGKVKLNADQVSLAIAKENPGLMGVVSKDQLESMLKKVLNDKIKQLSSKDHETLKFNSLSDRDYQKLVIKLVNEADLNTIAASFGITANDIVERLLSPETLKNTFEVGYLKIVEEAKKSSRDIAKLEKNWNIVWESRAVINALAKSLIIEKIFEKDFKDPNLNYGISTRVVSVDGKSFMIFNRNQLSYREYINEASNVENISSSGLEDLAFSWSCNSDLSTGKVGSIDYLPVWRANMLLGLEESVKENLAEFKQSQAALNILAEGLLAPVKDDKFSLKLPNESNHRAESICRARASEVKNALTKVLQISEDRLLELFYNFLGSEFFEKSNLSKQQTFPFLISKFLGILSGYDSKEAQDTLIQFINYLAANLGDERLVAKLAKEICFIDREPFRKISTKYDELKDYSWKSIHDVELAAGRIFEAAGMQVPSYTALKLLCIREVFAQLGVTEGAIAFVTSLDRYWDNLAKAYFAVNFLDLDLNPEIQLGDDKGSFKITVLKAKEKVPEIKVEYILKTQAS